VERLLMEGADAVREINWIKQQPANW